MINIKNIHKPSRLTRRSRRFNFAKKPTSSAPTGPIFIGYNNATFNASSETLSLPSGTQVGDLVICQYANGWIPNAISGWTQWDITTSANWQGAVMSKIMTSGDISTGTVTTTYSNGFNGVMSLATFRGFTYSGGIKSFQKAANGAGGGATGPTATGILINDLVLLFGSSRANGVNSCDTGTLLQEFHDSSNAAGSLYDITGIAGSVTPTFSTTGTVNGYYQTTIIIE